MLKVFLIALNLLCLCEITIAQKLDNILPVLARHEFKNDSISFVLTTVYTSFFGNPDSATAAAGKPSSEIRSNSIQIIDADTPWPPRWFWTPDYDTSSHLKNAFILPGNVSVQNGMLVFYTVVDTEIHHKKISPPVGYVRCNQRLEPVDTLVGNNREMDIHDITIAANGDKLYFEIEDTTLDVTFNGQQLTTVTNDNVEIMDATGKVVFHWNPLKYLGINSMYSQYCCSASGGRAFTNHQGGYDWARGCSLRFDFDGNILYSYRGIGIGKISRKDSSIIWRIDRSNQQMNNESDIIPIYTQHDFNAVKDKNGNIIYTVWSNGDESHNFPSAYQFTIGKTKKGTTIAKLLKKIDPSVKLAATLAGNYDVDNDGRSIINYGFVVSDTNYVGSRPMFELRDGSDAILNEYYTQVKTVSFRVHELKPNWRPERPLITQKNGMLTIAGNTNPAVWFRLFDKGVVRAEKVGEGHEYKPATRGTYCVATKYGIGYTVSKPFIVN